MEIYTDSDREYYEKIAPMGRKELASEVEKWQKKFKKEKMKWTFGTAWKKEGGDDLYFLCIEINRAYQNSEKEKAEKKERKKKK